MADVHEWARHPTISMVRDYNAHSVNEKAKEKDVIYLNSDDDEIKVENVYDGDIEHEDAKNVMTRDYVETIKLKDKKSDLEGNVKASCKMYLDAIAQKLSLF